MSGETMRRMLIVDDEPDLRDCLKEFFSAKGFAVTCAAGGDEAVDWLQTHQADVFVLDVNMPGLSGIDVLKYAKQVCPEAKIIMVSGVERREVQDLARHYGAIAYLTKPFDFSEMTWGSILAQLRP